jgi:hypothetical protein
MTHTRLSRIHATLHVDLHMDTKTDLLCIRVSLDLYLYRTFIVSYRMFMNLNTEAIALHGILQQ